MPLDFKNMIDIVLKQKEDIDLEKLMQMIEEKKRKVGAGYLTDQGALFLVGADLGISFDNTPKNQYKIKDLFSGAKDINLKGRVLVIYPPRSFKKKNTDEVSYNRTITIYDETSSVKIKLWDDQISIPDTLELETGDIINIKNASVRLGLDNKPIINLGTSGSIEKDNTHEEDIPTIDAITKTVDDISKPEENIIVAGKINLNPRVVEFRNQRGETGNSLQLNISNFDKTKSFRVLLWNVDTEKIPKFFPLESKIKLIGVKVKEANTMYSQENLEIHGDDGTVIEIENESEPELITLRIISLGKDIENYKVCLALDQNNKALVLDIDKALITPEIQNNVLVECIPSRILGNRIVLSAEDSLITLKENDTSFPDATVYDTKIKDISNNDLHCSFEAIVLQSPNTVDVTTKNGDIVSVTETLLGDDTAEIRVTGWREEGKILSKLNVGDRVKIIAAFSTKGKEDRIELTIKPFTQIEILE